MRRVTASAPAMPSAVPEDGQAHPLPHDEPQHLRRWRRKRTRTPISRVRVTPNASVPIEANGGEEERAVYERAEHGQSWNRCGAAASAMTCDIVVIVGHRQRAGSILAMAPRIDRRQRR